MRRSHPAEIKAYGYLSVVVSLLFLILFFANLRSHLYYSGPSYSFLLWIALYLGIIGFGLIRLRKWAAVLLALGMGFFGLFFGVLIALQTHFPISLFSALWSLLFFLPIVLVLPSWSDLK